ncbi:MAG: hypothetical protein QM796_13270 [Chthoniobacteraceae bacterium]
MLQEELELGEDCWGYTPNQSGGFQHFSWGWQHDDEFDCGVFMQLEQSKFCFKIGEPPKEKRREARSKWHEIFERYAEEQGFQVDRPGRFGNGEYMTVSVLRGTYRITRDDGLLDLPLTIQHLKKVNDGFKRIVAKGIEDSKSKL